MGSESMDVESKFLSNSMSCKAFSFGIIENAFLESQVPFIFCLVSLMTAFLSGTRAHPVIHIHSRM